MIMVIDTVLLEGSEDQIDTIVTLMLDRCYDEKHLLEALVSMALSAIVELADIELPEAEGGYVEVVPDRLTGTAREICSFIEWLSKTHIPEVCPHGMRDYLDS